MDNGYNLRPARRSDQNTVANLWEGLLSEQAELESDVAAGDDARMRWENDFTFWLHDESVRIVVCERSSDVVAYVHAGITYTPPIYVAQKSVFIREIFVEQTHRRKGIATALISAMRSWAIDEEADRIRLSTLYQNEDARSLWQTVGARPQSITYILPVPRSTSSKEEEERKASIGFGN